jgi:hypothetical protein
MAVFLVASGSYLLPFIFSCVIYAAMLWHKKKICNSKVDVFSDDDILHSENPISGIVASDFHMREPSHAALQSGSLKDVNLDTDNTRVENQEIEIKKAASNFDSVQSIEETKDIWTSKSKEKSISGPVSLDAEKIQQQQQENEENLPAAIRKLSSVENTLPDPNESITAESRNKIVTDLEQVKQIQILKQQKKTNKSILIVVEEIQCQSNLINLPVLLEVQGVSKIWT